MASNNRTSNMSEKQSLSAQIPPSAYPSDATTYVNGGNAEEDTLLMIAVSGSHNEKIKYSNFKSSILDGSLLLTGDQVITGNKTFENIIFDGTLNLSGNLSIDGDLGVSGAFNAQELFVTGLDGGLEKVYGGRDGMVNFSTDLASGSSSYSIDFPKTFGETPTVSASLQNDFGGAIVPFSLSSINTSSYSINFESALDDENYKVHTTARPTETSNVNGTQMQSFTHQFSTSAATHQVPFPQAFTSTPIISVNVESTGVAAQHIISSTSNSSFDITFDSAVGTDHSVHVHATR
jgi:hypothetical protein